MRNIKFIALSLSIIWTLSGCDKEMKITQPTIIIKSQEPYSVYDTIKADVIEFAEIDNERYLPEYYKWTIEDLDENIISDNLKDSSKLIWIPEKAGKFIIRLKIGYDKNKSITTLKEIAIYESVNSLKKKIIGKWKGEGQRYYNGEKWDLELIIDSSLHYYGKATYLNFNPYCEKGVFNTERLDFDNGQYVDSCGIPGDIPCQRIEITKVDNNKGFGIVWIGFGYVYIGEYNYSCNDVYDLANLELNEDGRILRFEFNTRGTNDYQEWEKKFVLRRQ